MNAGKMSMAYGAIEADAAPAVLSSYVEGLFFEIDLRVVTARRGVSVAVAFFAVKYLTSYTRFPWDLIVHGAALFASFPASVTLALAFLGLPMVVHNQ